MFRKPDQSVLMMLFIVVVMAITTSCAAWFKMKPIVTTIDEMARSACAIYFGDLHGINVKEAARTYCKTRDQFAPWIDPILRAQLEGATVAVGNSVPTVKSPPPTPEPATPATPAPNAPEPAPLPSTGPSPHAAPATSLGPANPPRL